MSVNLKEIFNEHEWLWLVAGVLIFAAGYLTAVWLNHEAAVVGVPVMEAVKTDEASRKISESVAEAQQRKDKLPEVVKSAKDDVVRDVAGDTDDFIADRWNGILGRYREYRTPSGGLCATLWS